LAEEQTGKVLADLIGVRTVILVDAQNINRSRSAYIISKIKNKDKKAFWENWLEDIIDLSFWLIGYLRTKKKFQDDYKETIVKLDKLTSEKIEPSFEELSKITDDLLLLCYALGITKIENEYPNPGTAFVRHIRGGSFNQPY